jgi:general secretion pathway protein B
MSVILDALKKLEHEKASRRSGPVDIVPEITVSPRRREKSGRLKITLIVTGAVILSAAATTLVMITFKSGHKESKPAPAIEPVVPVRKVARNEALVPPPPEPAPATWPINSVPPVLPEAASPPVEPERPVQRMEQRSAEHAQLPPERPKKSEETVLVNAAAPASIVVSGVAWQDDKKLRRAVVNGSLVAEGEEAGGARIVHIFRNKVRFSVGGSTFDVSVSGQSQGR